jgi:hypothetical protein
MRMHLTFDFDHYYEHVLTNYLKSHNIDYQIIESEITIHFSHPDQLKDFLTIL